MIVIVDYGMGNLRSILNKLQRMSEDVIVSSDINAIEQANKLVLPGVGSFETGMANLQERCLLSVLKWKVLEENTPILGICLGMQLLTLSSEEGDVEGLGWIDGETKQFNLGEHHSSLRVPHMGWNSIDIHRESPILHGVHSDSEFYFVHSYHVCCRADSSVIATTNYGYEFASVIQKERIYGTQFHPEKSHGNGSSILKNFIERA
ncbi:MAG: imidazole glycerol phosphate synthase subunit HisH [Chloroflexota bacterium]|nr:imidazole glycerol phosphate synthase subunit HisH [Chloroflexota bacterium]